MKDTQPLILKRYITRDGHISPIVEAPEIRPHEHFQLKNRLRAPFSAIDSKAPYISDLRTYETRRAVHCVLYELEET